MPLARWQANILFDLGSGALKAPGASIEIRREDSGILPQLYSDRAGTVTKGNPFTADADGYAFCFVAGGAYKITVTYGVQTAIWRYVPVGLLQESDGSAGSNTPIRVWTATGDVTIPDNDANDIHKIKNTSGAPISVYLPDVTQRSRSIRVVDAAGNAGTYPITVRPKAATTQKIMLGSSYIIDSNGASLGLDPDVTDANWM